jgi:uncharacterized membrane protein
MTANPNDLVVGVFSSRPLAEKAVIELWKAGIPHDQVDMVTREGEVASTPNLHLQHQASKSAIAGAVGGASAGAVAGALAMTFIPGFGTVIGGGLLAAILAGAAFGAAGGTFVGPFLAVGMTEDDAHYFAHHVDRGSTVVLVKSPERADEARTILRRMGCAERQPAGV